MKVIAVFALVSLVMSQSFAADVCKVKVRKAVVQKAQLDYEASAIQTPEIELLTSEIQGKRLISVYEASVLHCDPADFEACGSLTYEIVTATTNSSCRVLRVYMTGEE
ncbi:MAG: hypothetical protein OM95_04630 [Bdellovibrio sp. ArHS]|uniref:hypothetical protein n=1 Tax=Bdellovibrio sp. ArHS TaxID=1569284 RepID=UPI000582B313|nr:hypothetical protein [Bdellovibrio sp. ArHS]KHD89118.1 MAG: hypothetical protein OM95_04630 [Bdellovibrio sp. ArHS]